ncbi:MAG: aldose epimerase family protein [Lachnospiraceae bacterium]
MEKLVFGTTKQGEESSLYVLENQNHTKVKVTDFGATLVAFLFQDKDGVQRDVVLGYDTVSEYQNHSCYFGATVGRNCNRIENSKMVIDGKVWKVEANENKNNLHSGKNGFSQVMWEVKEVSDTHIIFAHVSTQEEQGFPGNLRAEVTYTLTDQDALEIAYYGVADADTIMNFTNHSYFNLGGHDSGAVANQKLQILADSYTPLKDSQSIPTGEIAPVEGTPMDFRTMKPIGADINADFEQLNITKVYDHNYVLSKQAGEQKIMANAYCEETKIAMEASTDCCGVQLYTGDFEEAQIGKDGAVYQGRCSFCLESQFYPNAINQDNFPSPLVKEGEVYHSKTTYRLYIKE